MSNAKKLVTIVLLVILMVMVIPFGVSKADSKPKITTSNASGKVGDTVTVNVSTEKAIVTNGYEIIIRFDNTKLELKSVTPKEYRS